MNANGFSGPLFIVGMPRSGTKLLRDLLNQHSQIGIPVVESHFIPYMIRQFGNPPNFENDDRLERFYEEFTRTPFFGNMQRMGRKLEREHLESAADITSWSSIFEVILRFYTPEGKDDARIWGDKTPGYVNHLNLLKGLYPDARFLHIIRDPRDYCLSVKKAWGKSLYRSADVWRKALEDAREDGWQLDENYMEVFYESLTEDPPTVLSSICDFLDCEFVPAMLRLEAPSENLGDTKGQTKIVGNNKRKYLTQLSPFEVRRIEEIVYPVAKSIGYEPEYGKEFRPLSPLTSRALALHDGWTSVRFHISEKGWHQGIKYFLQLHQKSSWR